MKGRCFPYRMVGIETKVLCMVLWTAQVPNQSVRTLLKMLIDMTEKEQARCPACGYCIMQSTESSIEKSSLSTILFGAPSS